MKQQNYSNHRRYIFIYHFVTFFVVILLFISSVYYTFKNLNNGPELRSALFLFLISFVLLVIFFAARAFGTRAQDRAIRAEENLRHFVLTGKLLDSRLKIHQITALRFASDEELVSLAQKAANDDMKPEDIKKSIKNWRADWDRV
jgi:uncharacterized membrane protein